MSTLFDDVETLSPPEENNKVGQIQSAMAGIASGIIKVPEGIVSLGAELMDATGMTTDAAARVEQAFDKINIFEETAQETAAGRITEALIQIGTPATAGATIGRKLALKALRAKKAGTYLNPKAKNLQKGLLNSGFREFEYFPYDPVFPEYGEPVAADLVTCIDVMEHIENEFLEEVLDEIKNITQKLSYFSIGTKPAQKKLSDGRNAHLIQKPARWWLPKLCERFDIEHFRASSNNFIVLCKSMK